jgi:hypothetical protein
LLLLFTSSFPIPLAGGGGGVLLHFLHFQVHRVQDVHVLGDEVGVPGLPRRRRRSLLLLWLWRDPLHVLLLLLAVVTSVAGLFRGKKILLKAYF